MGRRGQVPVRRVLPGDVVRLDGAFRHVVPAPAAGDRPREVWSGENGAVGTVVTVFPRVVHVRMPVIVDAAGRQTVVSKLLAVTEALSPPFVLALSADDQRLSTSRVAATSLETLHGPFRFASDLSARDWQYLLTLPVHAEFRRNEPKAGAPEAPAGGETARVTFAWAGQTPHEGWLVVEPEAAREAPGGAFGVVQKRADGAVGVEFEDGVSPAILRGKVALGFQALRTADADAPWAQWQFDIDPTIRVDAPFDRDGVQGRLRGPGGHAQHPDAA